MWAISGSRALILCPLFEQWAARTRVVHLHGLAERDHSSLAHMPQATLEPVVRWLRQRFAEVVTLKVFGEEDFESSLGVLEGSYRPVGHRTSYLLAIKRRC